MNDSPAHRSDSDCQPRTRPRSWRQIIAVAVIAIACADLPFALAWAVLEYGPAIEETPESSVFTPNPEMAPFISRMQENMTFVSPRLANVAQYWKCVLWIGSVVWGLAAAKIFGMQTSTRFAIGALQIASLAATSIWVGVFLAWPWIAVIAVDLWR